jgi:hypothetical protein
MPTLGVNLVDELDCQVRGLRTHICGDVLDLAHRGRQHTRESSPLADYRTNDIA